MFIKSAIAMLITIGFAGGAVYYGTGGQDTNSNAVELRAPEKISKTDELPEVPVDSVEKTKTVTTLTTVETVEDTQGQTNSEPEPKSAVVPGSQPAPELEPEAVIELEPTSESAPEHGSGFNLAKIMPLLMKQTEKISAVEIKDQAYLDIVNFSVSQRQFKFADAAMQEIDQTELRDTARSQIAIGLAMDGRADDAFEVIDAVEIDTLRDIMRLQVIEALILPGKLPPGLVRQ